MANALAVAHHRDLRASLPYETEQAAKRAKGREQETTEYFQKVRAYIPRIENTVLTHTVCKNANHWSIGSDRFIGLRVIELGSVLSASYAGRLINFLE